MRFCLRAGTASGVCADARSVTSTNPAHTTMRFVETLRSGSLKSRFGPPLTGGLFFQLSSTLFALLRRPSLGPCLPAWDEHSSLWSRPQRSPLCVYRPRSCSRLGSELISCFYLQKLIDLDIRVAVVGFLAKTTVTMVFKNETAVETEGEVRFREFAQFFFHEYRLSCVSKMSHRSLAVMQRAGQRSIFSELCLLTTSPC